MHAHRLLVSTLLVTGAVAMGTAALAQTTTPNTAGQTTTLPRATTEAQPMPNSGTETTAQRLERERLDRERLSATERANTMNPGAGNNTAGNTPMRDSNGALVARADRN